MRKIADANPDEDRLRDLIYAATGDAAAAEKAWLNIVISRREKRMSDG